MGKGNTRHSFRQRDLQRLPLYTRGFTIVELLIVVVVIAILAAITIVSYNGISSRSKESAAKTELTTIAKKVGIDKAQTGSYPASLSSANSGEGIPVNDKYSVYYTGGTDSFCAQVEVNGTHFFITQAGTIREGTCPGYGGAGSTMQAFTASQCAALVTYNGTNEGAVIELTDDRGGVTQTYKVAKLADGNCWMLTNLKLGSTASTVTLTSADSDVASNFILPQVAIEAGDYDTPRVYGPLPGDTNNGQTNYGYLYNWPAASAGLSRVGHPAGSGNSAHSVCPANWRLPYGGPWNEASNELSTLNARMAGLTGVNDSGYTSDTFFGEANAAHWQYSGPFKGVYSGLYAGGSLTNQGDYGLLWSGTVHPSDTDYAFGMIFFDGVGPHMGYGRDQGLAVRCIAR